MYQGGKLKEKKGDLLCFIALISPFTMKLLLLLMTPEATKCCSKHSVFQLSSYTESTFPSHSQQGNGDALNSIFFFYQLCIWWYSNFFFFPVSVLIIYSLIYFKNTAVPSISTVIHVFQFGCILRLL